VSSLVQRIRRGYDAARLRHERMYPLDHQCHEEAAAVYDARAQAADDAHAAEVCRLKADLCRVNDALATCQREREAMRVTVDTLANENTRLSHDLHRERAVNQTLRAR